MPKIYIVAGVPASGKSWVCDQLKDKFLYLRHDDIQDIDKYAAAINVKAKSQDQSILGDCPFAERVLGENLEKYGHKPEFIFISEEPYILHMRYAKRGKELPKAHITRQASIKERAKEWGCFLGTSSLVLEYLKGK